MVILSFVVWYFVGNLNQFSIFFFLVGFFFIVLSTMISMSIRNKKRRIINGGPINHGYMCTLIPKHKLILQFSWFGDEIRLSICQKIPADYYIRVCHRKYSSGDNGTQTTENMVFLISKNHNWNFPLHAWFDIESEKEAINRVSKENFEPRPSGCKPDALPTELSALVIRAVSHSLLSLHLCRTGNQTQSMVASRSGPTPTLVQGTPTSVSSFAMYC